MNPGNSLTTDTRKVFACMFLLLAVTLGTYANSLSNGFVWDDHQILAAQGKLLEFPSFTQVLTSLDIVYQDEGGVYYRPLHRYIHQLELYAFGLNPLPFHAVSILLHTVNVLLIFRLALALGCSGFTALVTALLLAVHPVNSEGVNFITSRQNMWVLFFTLTAGLVFLRGEREQRPVYSIPAALLFLGGLLCKETALMPLVFLAVLLLVKPPLPDTSRWHVLLRLSPFALALGGYAALRLSTLTLSSMAGSPAGPPLLERLGRNLYLIPKYAFNVTFPVKLSAYYSLPQQYPLGDMTLLIGWGLVVAFLVLVIRHRTLTTVGVLLWLVLNWLPISNIVPFPSAVMADRYLYLPAIGIWFLAACLAEQAHNRLGRNRLIPGVIVAVVATLSLLSTQRNRVWRNDLTLFESIVRAEPWASYAGYNLGKSLFEAGRAEDARREWERTVRIDPENSRVLNGLGNLAMMSGDFTAAEGYYRRSLTADPRNAETHYNLALIYEQTGRQGDAAAELELFLGRVPPEYADLVPQLRQKLETLRHSPP